MADSSVSETAPLLRAGAEGDEGGREVSIPRVYREPGGGQGAGDRQ